MKEVDIISNAEVLSATLFEANKKESVLIIASATGVRQAYYQRFAQFVAENGITVITFDYCGIGRSLKKGIKQLDNNAADWGRNDLESVIQYVIANYPNSNKVILGHSIGGQLVGLAKSSQQLDKIVLVAAQSGYWKYWKGIGRLKMWFNWYVLFPLILNIFGYLNSKKISGMENLPKNVANQWRNWGKKNNYLFSDKTIEETYYEQIMVDVTAFSIEDDDFAPLEAVDWLTEKFQNAKKKSVHLLPGDFSLAKIGHFGVFKERFKNTIWTQILDEIR